MVAVRASERGDAGEPNGMNRVRPSEASYS